VRNCGPATELGFRVPQYSVIPATTTLIRGTEGGTVAHRDRTNPRTLTVRRTFEPTRIAPACVVDAYERVVPIARRTIRSDRSHEQVPQRGTKRRKGKVE
jgi:hypothetical protein